MASSKDSKFHKECNIETSFDLTANPGPSNLYENCEFMKSCPTILEPSKDKSRSQEEIRYPLEFFSSHPNTPAPSFVPALVGSESIHSFYPGDEQQRNEKHGGKNCCSNCCSGIYNCYSICAIAFRNSRFFYVVQLLFSLLPLSTMVMGAIYSVDCNSTFPALTFIIGIFGAMFAGLWISINAFHHCGRRCSGQQKFLVRLLLVFLTLLLAIEMTIYFTTPTTFNPIDKSYCSKAFIDFTLHKYMAIGGSLLLATILYIPDLGSFICSFECTMPIASATYDEI